MRGKSIAFIGADGAGKSTVIGRLLDIWPDSSRYIYMGASVERANYSLPTSRWSTRRKHRAMGSSLGEAEVLPPTAMMTSEQKRKLPKNPLVKFVGLLNRVAEQWYRQMVIVSFKVRGYLVLCDRHFVFDYCPDRPRQDLPLSIRIHHWHLSHLYPLPDLVIFLDAAPEVLFKRKPEWTIEHLERQREGILEQARHVPNFVSVDASRDIETVVAEAADAVRRLYNAS